MRKNITTGRRGARPWRARSWDGGLGFDGSGKTSTASCCISGGIEKEEEQVLGERLDLRGTRVRETRQRPLACV